MSFLIKISAEDYRSILTFPKAQNNTPKQINLQCMGDNDKLNLSPNNYIAGVLLFFLFLFFLSSLYFVAIRHFANNYMSSNNDSELCDPFYNWKSSVNRIILVFNYVFFTGL